MSDSTQGSGNVEFRAIVQQRLAEHRRQHPRLPPQPPPKSRSLAGKAAACALGAALLGEGVILALVFAGFIGRPHQAAPPVHRVAARSPVHVRTHAHVPPQVRLQPHVHPVPLVALAPSRPVVVPKKRAPEREAAPPVPMPRLLSFQSPGIVVGGATVRVAYRASGSSVRVVAKIGPTVVSQAVVAPGMGNVTLQAPSSRRPRVLTLNLYVELGRRTDSASRTVIVLPPA